MYRRNTQLLNFVAHKFKERYLVKGTASWEGEKRREGSNILRVGAKRTRVEGLSGIWHPIICVYGLLQTAARARELV